MKPKMSQKWLENGYREQPYYLCSQLEESLLFSAKHFLQVSCQFF